MTTSDFQEACARLGFPSRQSTAEALGITRQHVWKLASGQLGVSRPTALLLQSLIAKAELLDALHRALRGYPSVNEKRTDRALWIKHGGDIRLVYPK